MSFELNFLSGRAIWGTLLTSVMSFSCVPTFSDETSRISEPRLLAVRSEPAEAKPGASVVLRALAVDEQGEVMNTNELAWAFCKARKPLTELGPVAPDCLSRFGESTDEIEPIGEGNDVSAVVPTDACRRFGPLSPPLEPGQSVPGRAADPDATGGFFQPILVGNPEPVLSRLRIQCGPSGLPQAEAVAFNQGYRPNENPEPRDIFVEVGSAMERVVDPIEVKKGETIGLRVEFQTCPSEPNCGDGLCTAYENPSNCSEDCGGDSPVGCAGPEGYLYPDPEQRMSVLTRERLKVSWFSSEGRFDLAVTDDAEVAGEVRNLWRATGRSGKSILWLVIRDDRGGTSWRSVEVNVTP
jgi:hypothetical protein